MRNAVGLLGSSLRCADMGIGGQSLADGMGASPCSPSLWKRLPEHIPVFLLCSHSLADLSPVCFGCIPCVFFTREQPVSPFWCFPLLSLPPAESVAAFALPWSCCSELFPWNCWCQRAHCEPPAGQAPPGSVSARFCPAVTSLCSAGFTMK